MIMVIYMYVSVTFLSFDVKEWIIENDLLVHRLKVGQLTEQ